MTRKLRGVLGAAVLTATLVGTSAGVAQASPAWNKLGKASGAITAIAYSGPDSLYATTSSGNIYKGSGGSLNLVDPASATGATTFRDIAVQPGNAQVVLAVGTNGALYRSGNAGTTWAKINLDNIAHNKTSCTAFAALGDLRSVKFARPNLAYIVGAGTVVLQSLSPINDPGSVGTTWTDVNQKPDPNAPASTICKTDADFYDISFPNAATAPVGTADGVLGFFHGGNETKTNDGFQTTIDQTNYPCSAQFCRLALDAGDANHQWASNGGGTVYLTKDGWTTYDQSSFNDAPGKPRTAFRDIAGAGGVYVLAGTQNRVYNSTGNDTFTYASPASDYDAVDWQAVDGYDKDHFAIGGTDGTVLATDGGSQISDVIDPTIDSISGLTTATAGQTLNYVANISDQGGSGVPDANVIWKVTGPNGVVMYTGKSVNVAFPVAGSYSFRVDASDGAGNQADYKTLGVGVNAAPQPVVKKADVSFTGNGATTGLPKTALPVTKDKKGRKIVKINIKGKLGVPAGLTKAQVCAGVVNVTVYTSAAKKPKTLGSGRATIKKDCSYKRTVIIQRAKVTGKPPKVVVILDYSGNANAQGRYKSTLKLKK